jgi:hypothetical protein
LAFDSPETLRYLLWQLKVEMNKSVLLFAATAILFSQSAAKTVQSEDVELRGIGHVKISAEEPDEGWLNLRFTDVNSGRVLATVFADKSDDSFHRAALSWPEIRFRVLHVAGFPDLLILGVAKAGGASDCGYQTIPIGVVHGKIRNLSPKMLYFATQGGIYLGKTKDSQPELALWYVQSINDVEHYGPHKYRFEFFRWNPKTGLLETRYVKTSRRYDSEREAAASFGLMPTGIIDLTTISSWFPEFGC